MHLTLELYILLNNINKQSVLLVISKLEFFVDL